MKLGAAKIPPLEEALFLNSAVYASFFLSPLQIIISFLRIIYLVDLLHWQ